jgi:soluble lytic murein transglycosylase-like protein
MSVSLAVARVTEIQQLLAGLDQRSTGTASSSAGFAAALAGTVATTPAAATTGTAAATGADIAGVPYADQINAAARSNGVEPALLAALVRQESNFNANAVSPAGARGLTQLMPGTAAELGVSDPLDPAQALDGGAKYLKQMLERFDGDERLALAAYNAGPGAVQRFGGVPPYAETQAYVEKVAGYADAYRRGAVSSTVAAAPATSTGLTYSTR